MVTRKPVPNNSAVPASTIPQIQIEEPTPTSLEPPEPWETFDSDVEESDQEDDTNKAGQHGSQPLKSPKSADEHVPAALRPGASSSASYQTLEEENVWVDAGRPLTDSTSESHGDIARIPTVLRPGSGGIKKDPNMEQEQAGTEKFTVIPPALRPGGGGAAKTETNPFKRKLAANATGSSAGVPSAPQTAPPAPPVPLPSFSQLSLAEQNSNPWQPALDERRDNSPAPAVPPMPEQDGGNGIWDSAKPSRQATPGPGTHSPALISLPSEGSAAWETESRKPSLPAPLIPSPDQEVLEDSHAWDDLGNIDKGKSAAGSKPMPLVSGASTGSDDWNMVEVEQPTTITDKPSNSPAREQRAPNLPPRTNTFENNAPSSPPPPPQPPRPVDKSETYQIKKITWHDASARTNPRVSPILVQNANGPCPLVALVNALSLTTPADLPHPSALVEALRTRERISLGLLLDAVFDELMSERRTKPDVALPDVAELYEFLKGLHTGMNVNPRFVPTKETINLLKRTSLSHVHPTDRSNLVPGTFEATKEMSLYATFSIPLIHGWLPPRDSPVYEAFTRQASSYEDTQNLLFREEELEAKLLSHPGSQGGMTPEEGQIYQDILTIKSFLSISATQLTNYGLDVIRQSMAPGSVAILFRNDHFSTLYRHPSTLELLTLVTDAGYAGHEEVVWESLVDVNGERAEFFSGDFRLVGHHHGPHGESGVTGVDGNDDGQAWTTVQGRRGGSHNGGGGSSAQQAQDGTPVSPSTEQEDRDLALALQLQEEEDERHRAEVARRRRESHLSEQFIEQQGQPGQHGRGQPTTATRGNANRGRGGISNMNPIAPARRSSNAVNIPITTTSSNTSVSSRGGRGGASATRGGRGGAAQSQPPTQQQQQSVRPLVPPALPARNGRNRGPDEGLDDAPPSYEQASKQTPYVPPQGHPSHPASAPASSSAAAAAAGASSSSVAGATANTGAGRGRGAGPFPGQPQGQGLLRQGLRPAPGAGTGAGGAAGNGGDGRRDRDCVVM
ncbi:protein FAM63A [Rhypophila decipiens]|uniref:Protein FAM63A n=1 Tax=Rhypophila decipiens TaxID=261697 RepID=A0AAN6Y8X4_9PEZI|nr:protein FAM63A [Rhypophila decipiens]